MFVCESEDQVKFSYLRINLIFYDIQGIPLIRIKFTPQKGSDLRKQYF